MPPRRRAEHRKEETTTWTKTMNDSPLIILHSSSCCDSFKQPLLLYLGMQPALRHQTNTSLCSQHTSFTAHHSRTEPTIPNFSPNLQNATLHPSSPRAPPNHTQPPLHLPLHPQVQQSQAFSNLSRHPLDNPALKAINRAPPRAQHSLGPSPHPAQRGSAAL